MPSGNMAGLEIVMEIEGLTNDRCVYQDRVSISRSTNKFLVAIPDYGAGAGAGVQDIS
jgi:hypothetical protein